MEYKVKIKFIHKGSVNRIIDSNNRIEAIQKALESLNLTEKDNVTTVLVNYAKNI